MLAAPSVQPHLLLDFAVLVGFTTFLVLVGARLYKGVAT